MKQKLLKLCAVAAFFILGQVNILSAQTVGSYRSKGNGVWGSGSVANSNLVLGAWEVYDGMAWIDAVDYPNSASNVTIRGGHTITIEATKGVNTLLIENGGVLKSTGSLRNMRVSTSIINNGSFGASGSNERVNIEAYLANGTITIGGTGNYAVGLIRTNGIAQNLDLIIDADINMSSYLSGPYTFTSMGSNSTYQYDDRVNIIINAGKTVTFGSSSYLHSNLTSLVVDNIPYGNYTYTINGTLDMSASGTSAIIEKQDTASVTTLNVNGVLKLGSGFRTASNAPTAPLGVVKLNIGTNGLVDATARLAGTNLVMTNGATNLYSFFNIAGDGKVRQNPSLPVTVAPSTTPPSGNVFRIGSNGIYSPVEFNNTINAAIDINVQDVNAGDRKAVKKVWTITSALSNLSTITSLKFGSLTADGVNGFNTTEPVSVYNWNGTAWNAGTVATVAGAGTIASPYTYEISSPAALGKFSVANETPAVLPLKFISFTAKPNFNNSQVILSWVTAEEKNTLDFIVERSLDGMHFEEIGEVSAKNLQGNHVYSAEDNKPYNGTAYYRIKQRDIDGKFSFSEIQYVGSKNEIAINIYPNPVANEISVTYPQAKAQGKVTIYTIDGRTIVSENISAGSTISTIDVSAFRPSVYLIEVQNGTERAIKKLVKN